MVVNPFWFGVLMTLVAEIMLFILSAVIQAIREERRNEGKSDEKDQ